MHPAIKIGLIAANFARKYGASIVKMNEHPAECSLMLGQALKELNQTLQDPKKGTLITTYESLEKVIFVKALMHITAVKWGVETKGKAPYAILTEIADLSRTPDRAYCKDIDDSLVWTKEFLSRPDVLEIFADENIKIELPRKPQDVFKLATSIFGRSRQEFGRVGKVLKAAKVRPTQDQKPKGKGPNKGPGGR